MKMDLAQTISLSHLYTAGRCRFLCLLKLSLLSTQHTVTRYLGLSHITQVHQWTPKWCPTVPFSSDAGQVSGSLVQSSVLTDLHSSGSVRGKQRQQSSKTPSCKLMVLSTTSLSSAVGQKVLGIQGSTIIGLLYRILPETLITTRGKRFTGQGIETRVSFLLDTLTPFRLPGGQQPGSSYTRSYNLKFPSSSQKIG